MQIVFETNFKESKEFLISYFNLSSIYIIFLIIIIFYFLGKLKIKLKNNKIKFLILICSVLQIFNIEKEMKKASVYRLVKGVQEGIKNIKIYEEMSQNLQNDVVIEKVGREIKNVVLVIGESTGRNHMSIYGYKYKTNPLLENLEKRGEIYKYIDVISPHSHTIPVLEKLLTFYDNEESDKWYNYNNIIDIMKKSGYKTYWFSNQEAFGTFGNVAAAIGNRSDIVLFNKLRDSSEEAIDSYDEEIVNKSAEIITEKVDKKFIVYHLMGTHTTYKYRYPKEFKKFNESNYDNSNLEEKKRISEYDNAILYNDYVINKIINLYKDKECIIFYLSDHGEEVYDFRGFMGHTESMPSRYMAEIPFLIYLTDEFKNKYPELEENIKKSLNRPYMTDDFIHTLLDITGIKTKEFNEEKSVINKRFIFTRKRIFGEKDYDKYWKRKD